MEILSIGEKIKRARIYKGLTLKDLSSDKISVSKLSCIENDKIIPDDAVLKYIAKKLEIDYEYISEDVKQQLQKNLNLFGIADYSQKDFDKEILYNIRIAENYFYKEITFKFVHILVKYYIYMEYDSEIQSIIPYYYDLCQKCCTEENKTTYFMDLAKFLYMREEYGEASNYYKNIRIEKDLKDEIYFEALMDEVNCYIKQKCWRNAFELEDEMLEGISKIDDKVKRLIFLKNLAIVYLRKGHLEKFKIYEDETYKICGDNELSMCNSKYEFASNLLECGFKDNSEKYIKDIINNFPQCSEYDKTELLLKSIKILIGCNNIELAEILTEESINIAININCTNFIQLGYYYKSKILLINKENCLAEMYMNLSLDLLSKFGSNTELKNRYSEIGMMYYSMGNVYDSLKYFTLSLNMEKKSIDCC